MLVLYGSHQGEGEEKDKVERVTPGENQGLEVVVDRHSDRRVKSSEDLLVWR